MDRDENVPRPLSALVGDAPLCWGSRSRAASAGATPFIDDQRLVMLTSHGEEDDDAQSCCVTCWQQSGCPESRPSSDLTEGSEADSAQHKNPIPTRREEVGCEDARMVPVQPHWSAAAAVSAHPEA